MAQPRYSPDGTRVAFNWIREPTTGLWVISLVDGKQILVGEGNLWPAGWSPDGEWVYAEGPSLNPLQIMRYSILGRPPDVVTSLECGGRGVISVHMTPDAKRFICLGEESRSDLWIAENVNLGGRVDR
jgi:Tol biopolymer transport system component